MNVLGYLRVSSQEQAESGYGMASQEQKIRDACQQRDWTLLDVLKDEGLSGKSLERPALNDALERIACGQADGLIVAKLDRLTRSVIDFGLLLEWFTDAQATLVALDLNVDTSTPGGKLVADVMAAVAEWERATIAQRTKDGLAARRAQGLPLNQGALSDRPEVAQLVRDMREAGMTLWEICGALEREGVPTARGGSVWRPSAITSVLGLERRRVRRRVTVLPEIGGRR